MKAAINRHFLEQTHFDSARPSGLATVVHQFGDPGEYEIVFQDEEDVLDRLHLVVADESAETTALPNKLDLDLGKVVAPRRGRPAGDVGQRFSLATRGYAVFSTPTGEGRSTILARRERDGKQNEVFDSRRLGASDLFAVTLVRPGYYSVTNTVTNARAKLAVAYPVVGKTPYRPPPPLQVECTQEGFSPDAIDLMPAQGIVFRFATPSRIRIDLEEPIDRPAGEERPQRPRWVKRAPEPPPPDRGSKTGSS